MQGLKLRQLAAWLVVLSAATLTGTVLSITQSGVFFPFSWTADYQKIHYAITIDAGSHGTRAHIFSWSGRVEDDDFPLLSPITIPHPEGIIDLASIGGISGFVNNVTGVGEAILKPIIDGSVNRLRQLGVATSEFSNVPIFLKATAGMRNTDVDSRDALMNAIRMYLNDRSPFKFRSGWARVISGEEEGSFGWIAVNNMLGSLLSPANVTVGALDLGGASAQITFMPTHTSVLEDFYEFQLGAKAVRLYSHSFLGYGWDDAHTRVTTRLALEKLFSVFQNNTHLESVPMKGVDVAQMIIDGDMKQLKPLKNSTHPQIEILEAEHPCFPRGSAFKFDVPSLLYPDGRAFLDMDLRAIIAYIKSIGISLDSPVVKKHFPVEVLQHVSNEPLVDPRKDQPKLQAAKRSRILAHGLSDKPMEMNYVKPKPFKPFAEPLPPPQVQYRVHFTGTGDFYGCQHHADQLFYQEPCFLSTCSFNGIYQPRIAESKFLALGQFSRIVGALNVPASSTPNTLAKAASLLCQTDWMTLRAQQATGTVYTGYGKHALQKLCWKATWAHALLTYGFGLDGDSQAVTFWTPPALGLADDQQGFPGWAVGSMIAELTFFPWQNTRGRFKAPFWWALSACICLVLLAIVQERRVLSLRCKLSFFEIRRSDVYEPIEQ